MSALSTLIRITASPGRWLVAQFALFQAIWFFSVLSSLPGQSPWLWLSTSLLALHFVLSPTPGRDLRVLPLALIGWAVDGLLIAAGLLEFTRFPWWLGVLWLTLVLLPGHSLRWLRGLPLWLVALIGAAGGAGSYLAGWRMGAVTLPYGVYITTVCLLLCWALILPLLVRLDQRLRRE